MKATNRPVQFPNEANLKLQPNVIITELTGTVAAKA